MLKVNGTEVSSALHGLLWWSFSTLLSVLTEIKLKHTLQTDNSGWKTRLATKLKGREREELFHDKVISVSKQSVSECFSRCCNVHDEC